VFQARSDVVSALNPIMLPGHEVAVRASWAEVEARAEAIAAEPALTAPDWGTTMLRNLTAVAAVMTVFACADPGAVTSPGGAGAVASANVAPCLAEQGQQLIEAGQYKQAIREFTCLIALDPTAVEGYRGRIEAELMLGRFSDAVLDYVQVMAYVVPVHPDAEQTILAGYDARLDVTPDAILALMGKSFAHWWFFDYPAAMHVLDHLLEVQPNDAYGHLFRGSSRLLQGTKRAAGAADLEHVIALLPQSPDVRFIVADAYTYGSQPDAQRALNEATFALEGGLDTPRIRAILGGAYLALGDAAAAAAQIKIHIDLVTTELVGTSPLSPGSSTSLGLVPGRTYDIPIAAQAGETISITTSSPDFTDTILVLLAPDGTAVVGSDDYKGYFAGFAWVAPEGGTYRLWVTSFEGASTGQLLVMSK
jgi:tetratricopeptide (TPR) repeat protein